MRKESIIGLAVVIVVAGLISVACWLRASRKPITPPRNVGLEREEADHIELNEWDQFSIS